MTEAMPTSGTREVIISSGNILNKAISLPLGGGKDGGGRGDEELFESLKTCVVQKQQSLKDLNDSTSSEENSLLNGNCIEVTDPQDNPSTLSEPRQDLKVTSKLFLYSLDRKDIIGAIDRALRATSVDYLDNLILCLSLFPQNSPDLTLSSLSGAWKVLEDQVNCGKVKTLGLSDLDTNLFINLHKISTIPPGIVQINLASCCVVPPELAEFCKENGIQLLTHKDSLDVLPTDKLEEMGGLLNKTWAPTAATSAANWRPLWVIRVQVHLKTRGVLATKAYLASMITTIPS